MFEDGNALVTEEDKVVEPVEAQEETGEESPATVETGEETPPADAPTEEAGEVEPTGEETAGEPEKEDKAPKTDEATDDRIAKLEKRLGYEQRQRKKLEKKLSLRQAPPEETDTAEPKAEDFETYEEYQAALIDHKVQSGINKYKAEQADTSQASDLEEFIEDTKTAGREMYSDFDAVVLAETVPMTKPMLEIMQDCENPESIAYYLGKNIAEATAISRMSQTQAARAIGKIEAKVAENLASPSPQPRKKVSKAPPPVKPTGSNNVVTKDPEKMTQDEYEQWRAGGGGT